MIGTAVELLRTGVGLVNTEQTEKTGLARRGVRLAGARHIVQAALTLAVPELRVLGVAVDGLHAASMIPVVAASRRYRRPALTQAVVAAVFAAAELWALYEGTPAHAPRRTRRR